MRDKILVSDFDGTMTECDFFNIALSHLPPSSATPWIRYEQGLTSHFNALAEIFSKLKIDEQEFDAMLTELRVENNIADELDHLLQAGWSLVIASAGCAYYIDRILLRSGIKVTTYANPGNFIPFKGLFMKQPLNSQFYATDTGIDKSSVVRHYLDQGYETAFAGDGRPDLAPALQVTPELRFAKGWLAGELENRHEPFVRFDRWSDIVGFLCRGIR